MNFAKIFSEGVYAPKLWIFWENFLKEIFTKISGFLRILKFENTTRTSSEEIVWFQNFQENFEFEWILQKYFLNRNYGRKSLPTNPGFKKIYCLCKSWKIFKDLHSNDLRIFWKNFNLGEIFERILLRKSLPDNSFKKICYLKVDHSSRTSNESIVRLQNFSGKL